MPLVDDVQLRVTDEDVVRVEESSATTVAIRVPVACGCSDAEYSEPLSDAVFERQIVAVADTSPLME